MQKERGNFWFPVKLRLWLGPAGPLARLAGAVVYFALLFAGLSYFRERGNLSVMLPLLGALAVALITTIFVKGERPTRWRWGDD